MRAVRELLIVLATAATWGLGEALGSRLRNAGRSDGRRPIPSDEASEPGPTCGRTERSKRSKR